MNKPHTNKDYNLPDPQQILDFFQRHKQPLKIDALLKIFKIKRAGKKPFEKVLHELADNGRLARIAGGAWTLADNLETVTGQFHALSQGGGYIVPEKNGEKEFKVHPLHTGGAWHLDRVKAALVPASSGYKAKIIEIIDKNKKEIVARIAKKQGKILICRPVDRKIPVNFAIKMEDLPSLGKETKIGALVFIKPLQPVSGDLWGARLLNIFGAENLVEVQEAIVKSAHHTPEAFPDLALQQARAMEKEPMDFTGRKDCRNMPFVTIDGKDARDFDDAIYVQKVDGNWILRVAIADVSHYVRPDSRKESLDAEALRRGNSWYFPKSVEPMLPRELSNGLCSLRPNEDRLAFMVEMLISPTGEIISNSFDPIVMRSAGRLVYEEVAAFFDNIDGDKKSVSPGPEPVFSPEISYMLLEAFKLYKVLARKRRERGALDFDLPEPEYVFDQAGNLQEMRIAQRNDAHKLIEEFMITANEAVARYIGHSSIPFLYRVHPEPDPQKIEALESMLQQAGIDSRLKSSSNDDTPLEPHVIQHILRVAADTPLEYVVNKLCLRSMQQARYQPENIGHFGLASPAYCHFTSPIRRYADLLVHRALKERIGFTHMALPDVEALGEIGEQLNSLERSALECEREMARRLGCLALKKHEGENLDGTISAVTDFGLFVEFDRIPTEGLIRIGDLDQDWYEFDQKNQFLIGQHTGKIWRLGQKVTVTIQDVNLDRLEIRLIPADIARQKNNIRHSRRGSGRGAPKKSFQPPVNEHKKRKTKKTGAFPTVNLDRSKKPKKRKKN